MSLVVILHESQDLVNVALVVRAMKNFGLRDLRLVRPAEYDTHRIAGIAHQTGDVVRRVRLFDDLDAALADCRFVVGFTARGRAAKRNALRVRDAVPEIRARSAEGRTALVFGREDKGLSNAELDRCHRAATIPANPQHSSLNLGQAFAVVAYEVFAAGDLPPLKTPRRGAPSARHESLERLFHDARAALDAIEFFKTRNGQIVMRTLRDLVHRTPLDEREVKLVRAMCLEVLRYLERTGVREVPS